MAWSTAGIQTNPLIDTILADTGAVADAVTRVTAVIGGNVAMVVHFEHRNAANNANLFSQVLAAAANAPFVLPLDGLTVAAGERLRVRINPAVTGSVQASLYTY
jgi:hypothetical protein